MVKPVDSTILHAIPSTLHNILLNYRPSSVGGLYPASQQLTPSYYLLPTSTTLDGVLNILNTHKKHNNNIICHVHQKFLTQAGPIIKKVTCSLKTFVKNILALEHQDDEHR